MLLEIEAKCIWKVLSSYRSNLDPSFTIEHGHFRADAHALLYSCLRLHDSSVTDSHRSKLRYMVKMYKRKMDYKIVFKLDMRST